MRRPFAICCALLAPAMSAACPDPKQSAPQKDCAKAYEKCVLSSGVLGVCDTTECANGESGPCLICRSQH